MKENQDLPPNNSKSCGASTVKRWVHVSSAFNPKEPEMPTYRYTIKVKGDTAYQRVCVKADSLEDAKAKINLKDYAIYTLPAGETIKATSYQWEVLSNTVDDALCHALTELNEEITAKKLEQLVLRRRVAEAACPFRAGDINHVTV